MSDGEHKTDANNNYVARCTLMSSKLPLLTKFDANLTGFPRSVRVLWLKEWKSKVCGGIIGRPVSKTSNGRHNLESLDVVAVTSSRGVENLQIFSIHDDTTTPSSSGSFWPVRFPEH